MKERNKICTFRSQVRTLSSSVSCKLISIEEFPYIFIYLYISLFFISLRILFGWNIILLFYTKQNIFRCSLIFILFFITNGPVSKKGISRIRGIRISLQLLIISNSYTKAIFFLIYPKSYLKFTLSDQKYFLHLNFLFYT